MTGLLCAWAVYRTRRHERRSDIVLGESVASGLIEPASLHPLIDDSRCIGCASCIDACPENEVLGLVQGKAQLIGPSHCIGHGACRAACPTGAITLVFGTEKRGVDIPMLAPNFETNVPGIFIAGELGGMGLIRNAFEQGRQAVDSVAAMQRNGDPDLDLVIVGAGPAGFSASLAAKDRGLRFVTIEQETLGGTIAHYPRGKLVMTRPARLPIVGKVRFTETSKECLLEFMRSTEEKARLQIKYRERVENIRRNCKAFVVETSEGEYRARAVLLAIGRRGTPRKIGAEGEHLGKVAYRLIDPQQYRNRRVLVVGGGDSALEAAATLSEQAGTTVTLSYRSAAFNRAKPKNRERIASLNRAGRLRTELGSVVSAITAESVRLQSGDAAIEIPNDDVIICAGGILPTGFLQKIGVQVETKFGTE